MRPKRHRGGGWGGAVGRLAQTIDGLSIDDLLPAEFDPDHLEERIGEYVEERFDACRRSAANIRVDHPHDEPSDRVDALFEPFIRGAVKVMAGGAAIEVVPLSILVEDATRNQTARSLLGRQIELLATAALLYDPHIAPQQAAADVLAVLDEVHGLATVREDIRRKGLLTSVKDKGAEAAAYVAAKLVLRQIAGLLFAGGRLFEAWRKYSRFRELRVAVADRFEPFGGNGPGGQ